MLIRLLHWVARDVLPDKMWVRWLQWRYQRENRPTRKYADPMETQQAIYNYRQEQSRSRYASEQAITDMVERQRADHDRRGFAQQAEVYDCDCPVQRTMAGDPARQFHSEDCQHFSPYRKGGVIKVDRHLIPHRPGRGICDCAACNPSGAIFSC